MFGLDENGDYVYLEDEDATDRTWCAKTFTTTFVANNKLSIKLVYGYKYEEFDLTFNPEGELIGVDCVSSPNHATDKEQSIRTRIKNRLVVD